MTNKTLALSPSFQFKFPVPQVHLDRLNKEQYELVKYEDYKLVYLDQATDEYVILQHRPDRYIISFEVEGLKYKARKTFEQKQIILQELNAGNIVNVTNCNGYYSLDVKKMNYKGCREEKPKETRVKRELTPEELKEREANRKKIIQKLVDESIAKGYLPADYLKRKTPENPLEVITDAYINREQFA